MDAECLTVDPAWTGFRSQREEIANAISHGVGLTISILGGVVLLVAACGSTNVWCQLGCAIYAGCAISVYAASTLSHAVREPRWRQTFRVWDQGLIYLMIAGTYTPFGLVYLRTPIGWTLTGAIWAIAAGGFLSKVFWTHRIDRVAIWVYVALGWLPILAWPEIRERVPLEAAHWMLAGGLAYTIGTVFLVADDHVPFFHAVWHVLVIAGTACHFWAIYSNVLPGARIA
jgi:hemolysin III